MILQAFYAMLADRRVIWALFFINIIGTIYGYVWYGWQLKATPPQFLPFVPDSPTASLFFVFVLLSFLWRKHRPYLEALAMVTLFKYGIWAVVMNILMLLVNGNLPWQGYMLIVSHFAMAVEGMLYAPFYRFKMKHLLVAAVWTLHNDIIDYVFMQFPRYEDLYMYIREIGYFTFWLSIFSLFTAYVLAIRSSRPKLEL
ncbi:hypothetical protein BpJC7_29170 [Weizmannia acidilactici]|uniref:DUF1405 domain-containing protein n=1 Tax=Weizmannia acidilactici TaxID=2607726 RepID=A0A5J4JR76_9BACI|nr:DUF1405 domain-containing protein [Weizmannia acidilactici]GER66010.1 hypothetical protein BpJC4_04810 [Weizmannia acidilactici]GER71614.1 hypothetical protein BpJC7_29170 [Weizmannia acidilactici]GER74947.1 hypothetical protein BpPP18_30140 [Weizmannia acidilactici]